MGNDDEPLVNFNLSTTTLTQKKKKKKVAMVRCELFLVSVLTLVCALFRVQIGGGDNGVICVSGFNRSHKGNPGAG